MWQSQSVSMVNIVNWAENSQCVALHKHSAHVSLQLRVWGILYFKFTACDLSAEKKSCTEMIFKSNPTEIFKASHLVSSKSLNWSVPCPLHLLKIDSLVQPWPPHANGRGTDLQQVLSWSSACALKFIGTNKHTALKFSVCFNLHKQKSLL